MYVLYIKSFVMYKSLAISLDNNWVITLASTLGHSSVMEKITDKLIKLWCYYEFCVTMSWIFNPQYLSVVDVALCAFLRVSRRRSMHPHFCGGEYPKNFWCLNEEVLGWYLILLDRLDGTKTLCSFSNRRLWITWTLYFKTSFNPLLFDPSWAKIHTCHWNISFYKWKYETVF